MKKKVCYAQTGGVTAAMLLEFEKMAASSNTRRAGLFDPDQAQATLDAYVERKSQSK